MPRTDVASRIIAARPRQIYDALLDADALVEWLPPAGMTGEVEHFDPRPGGSYRMVLTYVEAPASGAKTTSDTDVVDVRFVDLVPGARVVEAADFVSDDPAFAGTMTMTWEITALTGGSRVDVTADGVPDAISAEDHAAGLRSSLENLARFLERRPGRS